MRRTAITAVLAGAIAALTIVPAASAGASPSRSVQCKLVPCTAQAVIKTAWGSAQYPKGYVTNDYREWLGRFTDRFGGQATFEELPDANGHVLSGQVRFNSSKPISINGGSVSVDAQGRPAVLTGPAGTNVSIAIQYAG